jgi:serine O-acetyltransferase
MNQLIKRKWLEDKEKYPNNPWLKECSIIAIYWYRHGQSVDLMKESLYKKIHSKLYWLVFHFIEILLGISIPKSVKSGGGLRIFHFGNIFIHPNTVLGSSCILRQGVTLGNRYNDNDAPKLCDRVELGAYSQVLGKVVIGSDCKIGAMSVVLTDITHSSTACGAPAKIVTNNKDLV